MSSDDSGTCERCGARLGRGAIHVAVTPSEGADPGIFPALDACRRCAESLSRWLASGRDRNRVPRKSPAARSRTPKNVSRRDRERLRRDVVALVVTGGLSLMLCYMAYYMRLFSPE